MRADIKIKGLDNVLQLLQSLPPEVVSKRGGPVKAVLARAARLIRDEAKANVRRIIEEPNIGGRDNLSTGALEKSIVATRGKPPIGGKGERYIVWPGSARKAYKNSRRNQRLGRTGTDYEIAPPQFYGKFLEYGTKRMSAKPWLRPAFQKKREAAVDLIERELPRAIDRIIRKMKK